LIGLGRKTFRDPPPQNFGAINSIRAAIPLFNRSPNNDLFREVPE